MHDMGTPWKAFSSIRAKKHERTLFLTESSFTFLGRIGYLLTASLDNLGVFLLPPGEAFKSKRVPGFAREGSALLNQR